MAFDYQFKIKDQKLKELLQKKSLEIIILKIFNQGYLEKEAKKIYLGCKFNIVIQNREGCFYGSVISTFNKQKLVSQDQLTLHIYRLAWEDQEQHDNELKEAIKASSRSFSVENALEYQGDWTFKIPYQPIMKETIPSIKNVKKLKILRPKVMRFKLR